jgi:hypothetical protein
MSLGICSTFAAPGQLMVNLLRFDEQNYERTRYREAANEVEQPDDADILP